MTASVTTLLASAGPKVGGWGFTSGFPSRTTTVWVPGSIWMSWTGRWTMSHCGAGAMVSLAGVLTTVPAMRSGLERSEGLIERERELAEIDQALGGAVVGEGWLQLFEGPAGIGKTALLDAARERAEGVGVVVMVGRGDELERKFPYGVVRQLLEPVVRAAGAATRERLLAGAAALAAPVVLGLEAGAAPVDRGRDGRRVLHLRALRAAAAQRDGRHPRYRCPARRRAGAATAAA